MWLESFLNHNIFYPMKRPSRIEKLRIILNSWFPPGSFSMTLFGTVYTKSSYAAENLGKEGSEDNTHEMIHVKQAQSCWDCWLSFYFLYLCQWLFNLPLITIDRRAPYKFIPFEIEAYKHQREPEYIKDIATEWKEIRKLKMSERKRLAKMYYKEYRKTTRFTDFIKEHM